MSTDTPFNVVKDALSGVSSLKEGDGVEGEGETVSAVPVDFVPVDSLRIDRTAIIKFKKAGDVSPFRLCMSSGVLFLLSLSVCLSLCS